MAIFESRSPFKSLSIRSIFYVFLIILTSAIQAYFLEFISIGFFKPNILLILIVWVSLFENRLYGILIGFLCGISVDIMTPDILGSNSLFFTFCGFVSGSFYHEDRVKKNLTTSRFLIIIFLSSVIYNLFYYFMYQDFKTFSLSSYFTQNVIISSVYTIVIAIIPMLVSTQFIKR